MPRIATPASTSLYLKTLLESLVSMPTFSKDVQACRAALHFVRTQIQGLPLYVSEIEYDGHPALIMSTRKTKRPKILFLAHIDIMDAAPDMLTLRSDRGRYYGRGVFDMKGMIATYVTLLLELGPNLPQYDLAVALTSDEEMALDDTAAE